jgi:ATP-dependent DNA ligase
MTTKTELFKLDARGQIRIWIIWVEHRTRDSLVHVRHGVNGSTLVTDNTPFSTYNHEAAAQDFMRSKINYMRDRRGYTETIPVSRPFRPMLLQRYKDRKESLPPHVYIQPKLNGIRCLASKHWLKTRTNDNIGSCQHILDDLQDLPDDVVLDGELYNHYLPLQRISGAVRNYNTTTDSATLSLWVFDIIEESQTFSERTETLGELFTSSPFEPHLLSKGASLVGGIHLLNTLYLHTNEIESHHQYYLQNGYEGSVIRNPYSHYQLNTRVPGVLKYKPIQTMNVKIIDILPCVRAPLQGKFLLQNPKGGTFTCSYKAPHIIRERVLKNKSVYIGKLVKVEYEDYSNDDKPLKPIGVQIYGV